MEARRESAKGRYRRIAPLYDWLAAPALSPALQLEAVDRLELRPGQGVLDAGCGTGSTFSAIRTRIGERGRIIGIDAAPEMLDRARRRSDLWGWTNVTLVEAAAEKASPGEMVDAVLFSFTHDILQSRKAIRRLLSWARPGARVAACGVKWAKGWGFALNGIVACVAANCHSEPRGLQRPWVFLEPFLADFRVWERGFGTLYVAAGTVSGRKKG